MKRIEAGPRRGATLLETILAVTLFAVFAGSATVLARSTSLAYRTESHVSGFEFRGQTVLGDVADRFRAAAPDSIDPPGISPPGCSTWLSFQRIVGYEDETGVDLDDLEQISLAPDPRDPPDGIDNDGDELVDEGELHWIQDLGGPDERRHVLCRGVAASLEGEIPGNGEDDNGNGLVDEPGFCLSFDGSTATFRLTTESMGPGGLLRRTTAELQVAVRAAE